MTTFRLSPWARDALTVDEAVGLRARANALGAHVSVTAASPRGPWTVYATTGSLQAGGVGYLGNLASAVHVVLDEFARQKDILDEQVADLFTPDELVVIANQSGIGVSRG